jgi:hypothetical protein
LPIASFLAQAARGCGATLGTAIIDCETARTFVEIEKVSPAGKVTRGA